MALFSDVDTQKKNENMADPSLQFVYTTEQKVSADSLIFLRQANKEN